MTDTARFKRLTVILLLSWVFISCAAVTRYTLYVDAASFFSEEEKTLQLLVPEGFGLSIYLFPSIYPDFTDSGPDTQSKKGLEYSYSSLAIPEGGELTFRLETSMAIDNLDTVKTIPDSIIELYGAPYDAENLYQEGTVLISIGSGPIAPGGTINFTLISELSEGDAGFELIKSGEFRLGIHIRIEPASLGGDVEILYSLETLEMELGARPFGLLP